MGRSPCSTVWADGRVAPERSFERDDECARRGDEIIPLLRSDVIDRRRRERAGLLGWPQPFSDLHEPDPDAFQSSSARAPSIPPARTARLLSCLSSQLILHCE